MRKPSLREFAFFLPFNLLFFFNAASFLMDHSISTITNNGAMDTHIHTPELMYNYLLEMPRTCVITSITYKNYK